MGPPSLEDPGSGITAILGWLGETLEHGDENDAMAIWTDEGWKQAGEVYGGDQNQEFGRIAAEIAAIDLDDVDRYDQVSLREWLEERTSSEGVIGLFEFMAVLEGQTGAPGDHSASDNLFMRSLHLRERRKPGYRTAPWADRPPLRDGRGGLRAPRRRGAAERLGCLRRDRGRQGARGLRRGR